MSASRTSSSRRIDTACLVWSLLFGCVAALGIWIGLGHDVRWEAVARLSPIVLMCIGALGLLVNRINR